MEQDKSAPGARGPRFADRFELHETLGRGGMAVVHRATDLGSGRTVALKALIAPTEDEQRAHVELLFEREFHTLSQLSHPCVIEVYDYGVTADGVCYYTMELLDGGALRNRVPVPWREACRLLFDVCSSLALLHSRRLVHRDVTPRNVHCTSTGAAKLIDFGAVVPMSAGGDPVVGTPGFTAPEVVHRSGLDGRTDLYSLGATLYYVLTGQLPYPARNFGDLIASWNQPPAPPSARVPDIPSALDDLTMSLLSLEPALRPPSAFAVMQRLAAIAGLQREEADSVSRAYLATPALTGRDPLLARVRELSLRALSTGGRGAMIWGAAGSGRSRMLDACMLEAKTLGACVLRANARGKPQDFEVAFALAQHLLESMPSEQLAAQVPQLFAAVESERPQLRPLAELRTDREALERSLVQLMRVASKARPLVFAVDDLQRIDEPSAAVLAALIDRFRYGRAFAVLTVERDGGGSAQVLEALSRRCEQLTLPPLDPDQTRSLFASVFGEVPNLSSLAEEIHGLAHGNPRASLELAQYLVDHGVITYTAGTWTLPARLSQTDLPQTVEDAVRARIEALSPLARFLVHAHALSFVERLEHEDYRALAGSTDRREVDAAVDALIAQQALAGDGERYVIGNRAWSAALAHTLDPDTRERAHAALARLFEPRFELAWLYHVLASERGEHTRALDALVAGYLRVAAQDYRQTLEEDVGKLIHTYPRAIELARRLGRPARQLYDLHQGLIATSIAAGDPASYWHVAPEWLGVLVRDSGLDLWRRDSGNPDPGARLTQALTKAFERHQAQPEHERVYRPDEAIAKLAEYVAISIAISGRTMDLPLLVSLPELLEPFAPLSPLLDALWQNAIGAVDALQFARFDRARERWTAIYDKLREQDGMEVRHVRAIRNAVAYALGMIEAGFGLSSAAQWADELEQDPFQQLSALYLRKIVRLEQGDWTGAEKLQRSAELLALRARIPSMFTSTLTVEISAHALARDLAGVRDVIERERVEAARYPGWIPYLREAEARFELIRGDFAEAKASYDQLIAQLESVRPPRLPVWVAAVSGRCEALLGLDRPAEARDSALAALARCGQGEIHAAANELTRLLALAEAKLGDFESAVARLDALIAAQIALGVTGLRIGVTYEARAEVALSRNDARAFETFARLTAREYRHGARCPLSARYERLMLEARRRGIQPAVALSDFEPTTAIADSGVATGDLHSVVRHALGSTADISDSYARALRMVCSSRDARGGHLYLCTQDGPQLVASCDLAAPPAELREYVRDFVEEEQDRFETQTLAVSEPPEAQTSVPLARAGGMDYELLLLTQASAERPQFSMVIAIAPGQSAAFNPRQPQLLASIAETLARLASGR